MRRINLEPRFGSRYIAFMIHENRIIILAIAHGKRKPGYFTSRIDEAKDLP